MKNRFVKDVAIVTSGNVVFMIANILVGFLLPLLVSVEDYGYYKIYTLYLSYSGLLHFGFIDGVYLEYAGYRFEELDKKQFRTFSIFMISLESVLACLVTVCSFLFLKNEYLIIGVFIAVGLIAINVGQYYQYVSQALSRFSEFSKRKIYNAIGIIISLLLLLLYNKTHAPHTSTFWMYILMTLVVSLALTIWFVVTYKDITFGERNRFKDEKETIIILLKRGFTLTLAYEASRIVLLIDRQFVSLLFPLELYAKYAFAYNILSCVTSVIIGISTVIFPKLKRMTVEESISFFPDYMMLMAIIVCFFLSGYYPIVWIVKWILPNYVDSLVYFQIVFPVLALSSCITIIIFAYYKLYNKNLVFLVACIITLAISVVMNYGAFLLFHTAESISIASVFTSIIWYIITIAYLVKKYKVRWGKNFIYTILMIIVFYITTQLIKCSIISIAAYLLFFIMITFVIYKKDIIRCTKGN